MEKAEKKVILLIIMILTFNITYWQVPNATEKVSAKTITTNQITIESEWETIIKGIRGVYSLIQTSDGGYALAGTTFSYWQGEYENEMWLMKTNTTGHMDWNITRRLPNGILFLFLFFDSNF